MGKIENIIKKLTEAPGDDLSKVDRLDKPDSPDGLLPHGFVRV